MWQTIRSTGVQTIAKVATVFLSLITVKYLTNGLGVEGYGNLVLITSIFLLFDALADFGTRIIGVREMVEAGNKAARRVWVNLFRIRLLLNGVVFGLGSLFVWWYPGFTNIRFEAWLGLLMSWGTMVAGSMEMIWQYKARLELKAIVEILFPSLFLIIVWWWGKSLTLGWILGVYLIARWMSLLVGGWNLRQWWMGSWSGWDGKLIKRLLKESWPMGLYLLLFTGYDRAIDSMMIRHFWGAAEVGWYGLAYKIYSSLIMPAYFLVSSVYPLLARKETEEKVYRQSRIILLVMVLMGAPLVYWLAPVAVSLLANQSYAGSIRVLRILIVAMIFSYLNHLNGFSLISRKKQKQLLVLGLIVLTTNIIGNLIAIPIWGIYGAAWVTVLSELVMWIMTTILL